MKLIFIFRNKVISLNQKYQKVPEGKGDSNLLKCHALFQEEIAIKRKYLNDV